MKDFKNGSDTQSFKKADIIELIQQLDAPSRKILKAKLANMNEQERIRAFSTIRAWVLRKLYPDKFKKPVPFYEDLRDILSIDE